MNAYLHLQHWTPEPEKKSVINHLTKKTRHHWQKTPLYGFSLSGQGKHELFFIPTDSWPGSQMEGQRLLEGKFILGSETALESYLWFPKHLSDSALSDLHSFEWLRHLRSIGDNASRRATRQFILSWINHNQNWRSLPWKPDILGHRISTWIGLYDFFCASADDFFRQTFFKSLYRQTKHLSQSWKDAPTAPQKLYALHGLIYAIICLNFETNRLPSLFEHLHSLIQKQIYEDGGHISRSPLIQLMILRILIDLKSFLRHIKPNAISQDFEGKKADYFLKNPIKQKNTTSEKSSSEMVTSLLNLIQKTISRMAPIVRLFRHGDGGLACFGPYQKINPNLIDMILSLSDVKGRPPMAAPLMGYERSVTKTGLLLTNLKPSNLRSPIHTVETGTGIFNFEWSTPKQRLITFSDVVIQTESSGQTKRFAQASNSKHSYFDFDHKVHPDGSLLEAEFQSHHPSWNFSQSRSLFLSNTALDFRGEDIISSHIAGYCAIRFVLHPDLKINYRDKRLYIDCPDGQRWIGLFNSQEIHLEVLETAYPAKMVMLLSELLPNQPCKIKWAFQSD